MLNQKEENKPNPNLPQAPVANPQVPKDNEDPMIGKVFFNKYTLTKKLGAGSFGSIYSATCENEEFAIKFEDKNKGQNLLESEAYVMSYLHGPRIPFVKSYGYSSNYNVLVMELMGKSLEDHFSLLPNKKMSIRCVCNIALQMVDILEFIHNKHIIHRDIKPDNFVVGRNEKSRFVFLLDFGLAKKYRSSTTLKHYPLIKKKRLTGTARYASINALNGITQSRRDDLEAVGYVLMYFLRGRLPWQGLMVKNKEERYLKIMEKKRDISPFDLCQGFPEEFANYIKYCRELEYEQDPDYQMLKNLFYKVLENIKFNFDYFYDWNNTENEIKDDKDKNNELNDNDNNKVKEEGINYGKNNEYNLKDENKENKNFNIITNHNNEDIINNVEVNENINKVNNQDLYNNLEVPNEKTAQKISNILNIDQNLEALKNNMNSNGNINNINININNNISINNMNTLNKDLNNNWQLNPLISNTVRCVNTELKNGRINPLFLSDKNIIENNNYNFNQIIESKDNNLISNKAIKETENLKLELENNEKEIEKDLDKKNMNEFKEPLHYNENNNKEDEKEDDKDDNKEDNNYENKNNNEKKHNRRKNKENVNKCCIII